ncbi:MAG: hypothetical protein ACJA2W_000794 [Planctomycetota bacterium]|jgi:hypothetical protein
MRIVHLRQMGSSQDDLWEGHVRWGRGKCLKGSPWSHGLALSIYLLFERSPFRFGVGIAWGYLNAAFRRNDRDGDSEYRKLLPKR